MKKTIKIFFAVFMSVLIICFSCVTAFADTSVDDNTQRPYDKDFFNTVIQSYNINDLTLSFLPLDDYFVTFNINDGGYFMFIPTAGKHFVLHQFKYSDYANNSEFLKSIDDYSITDDDILIAECVYNDGVSYCVRTSFNIYHYQLLSDFKLRVEPVTVSGGHSTFAISVSSPTPDYANQVPHLFFNCAKVYELLNYKNFVTYNQSVITMEHNKHTYSTDYISSLFVYLAQIIPCYIGAVYDSSLEYILESNGKTCDDTIIDKYKYQIYYSLNNDLRMVFLNNAYQPEYKKDKFQGTNSDDAYKYKFHYNKTSDCIVYYPTFKMYLSYDDWYKFQPEDKTFKWWWEEDTKDFTLISDWKYSNGNYIGTRVATNWEKLNQLGESADFIAISSFITDKDKLLNNGWKDGRPSDTNYPYCIEVDYNGKAGLFIYSNSKPKVSKVDIISDTHKQFNIYMIGMYGYVYNAINNCYINYDFTIKDGQKNFVQQYLFKYFSYELHCLDSDLNLTLYENYKGSVTDYKGTRVFFNWDITQDLKLSADDLQKIQNNCKEDIGAFTDSNGNHHGGNLNNYSDEDKNKFNESGSNSDSTTDNNFDFSFNGIMNYCDSFFSFIQSAFSVFPASIWVLISLSIAMLVFLRVLGR